MSRNRHHSSDSSDSSYTKESSTEPPSPPDEYESESSSTKSSSSSHKVPVHHIHGSVMEQLEAPFLIATNEAQCVRDARIQNSALRRRIIDTYKTHSYEDFKKNIREYTDFQITIFEQINSSIKSIFRNNILSLIAMADPAHYEDLFKGFPGDVQDDIACLIDIMMENPESFRILRWFSQQLCQVPVFFDYQKPDGVKLMINGVQRDFWGRHSTVYWAILYNNNIVRIYRASDNKFIQEIKCDIIWLSRSKKTIKFSSTPAKIDFMLVPPEGYDTELWETHALRTDESIPYYSSFPYFEKRLPDEIYAKDKKAIEMHDMLIVRALLRPEIVKPNDSKKLMEIILTVYSYLNMNHAFYSMLCMREACECELNEREMFNKKDSYLTVLIDLLITKYCSDYFSSVIGPLLNQIDNGQLSFNGPLNIEAAASLIATVIRNLDQNIDRIPPQLQHLMSIMRVVGGVRYGKRRGAYLGGCLIFFEKFLFKMMENASSYFTNFRPTRPPAEFLAQFANLCRAVFLMRPIVEYFPDANGLEALVEPHRQTAISFIERACVVRNSPAYAMISEKQYKDAMMSIIEIASSRNKAFMHSIKTESAITLRTPIAGSVMHFLYYLANRI